MDRYDVAIIGCGRVGLPLALAFADAGLRTIGIDNDQARLGAVVAAAYSWTWAMRRPNSTARRANTLQFWSRVRRRW